MFAFVMGSWYVSVLGGYRVGIAVGIGSVLLDGQISSSSDIDEVGECRVLQGSSLRQHRLFEVGCDGGR